MLNGEEYQLMEFGSEQEIVLTPTIQRLALIV